MAYYHWRFALDRSYTTYDSVDTLGRSMAHMTPENIAFALETWFMPGPRFKAREIKYAVYGYNNNQHLVGMLVFKRPTTREHITDWCAPLRRATIVQFFFTVEQQQDIVLQRVEEGLTEVGTVPWRVESESEDEGADGDAREQNVADQDAMEREERARRNRYELFEENYGREDEEEKQGPSAPGEWREDGSPLWWERNQLVDSGSELELPDLGDFMSMADLLSSGIEAYNSDQDDLY